MIGVKIIRKMRGRGIAGIKSLEAGPSGVKFGFPAGKTDGGVIERAVWNNFGTRGGASGGGWGGPIPERPFMQNAIRAGRSKFKAGLKSGGATIIHAAALCQDVASVKRGVMAKLGIVGQGMVQQEITALQSPPNSPVTIALKGSSKPLIDSGEMRGTATWKIVE